MAILTLMFGRDVVGTYEISKDKMILGRADDCDVVIDNLAVSRHHAIIEKKESEFTVNDLDSNNGTFINGQRIGGPTPLNFGDEIGIGKHIVIFDTHSSKGKIAAALASSGEARPDMDTSGRGTMFVEPEKMEKIQKKVTTARKAHLRVKEGTQTTPLIPIEKSDIVFGKAPDCDIKVKGLLAARRHAILTRLENGYQITNLAVLSPTRVNGARIESALLCDSDEVRMGRTTFVFHSEQ
ncbi:MAG: FHA domain-containing protein [Candidatus Abyssobacteria bacterium SURF_17]|jgi:pSer/pThr/pTyr-binding forkhead associated (FHA) protein|uniref:FHA domain-containing protein n=1 Tax=Candidatus Abyssobacteria bacterium SURF_17 TaxID=2093361 RepID=A0A419ERV2_9BACT|nr:MAG: FHA domain-containing protein [Candidatus Abyssubacteria bacterium SURF_17]